MTQAHKETMKLCGKCGNCKILDIGEDIKFPLLAQRKENQYSVTKKYIVVYSDMKEKKCLKT